MNELLPSFDGLLEKLTTIGGSDLHLKVGSPPAFRIDGVVHRSDLPSVTPADTERYLDEIVTERAHAALESSGEADFAIGLVMLQTEKERCSLTKATFRPPTEMPSVTRNFVVYRFKEGAEL